MNSKDSQIKSRQLTVVFSTPAEKVTEIKTNIFVTSFGPVSDTEMVRRPLH